MAFPGNDFCWNWDVFSFLLCPFKQKKFRSRHFCSNDGKFSRQTVKEFFVSRSNFGLLWLINYFEGFDSVTDNLFGYCFFKSQDDKVTEMCLTGSLVQCKSITITNRSELHWQSLSATEYILVDFKMCGNRDLTQYKYRILSTSLVIYMYTQVKNLLFWRLWHDRPQIEQAVKYGYRNISGIWFTTINSSDVMMGWSLYF